MESKYTIVLSSGRTIELVATEVDEVFEFLKSNTEADEHFVSIEEEAV